MISDSKAFFLWDYEATLFPLSLNRLMVERYTPQLRDFITEKVLIKDGGGFNPQHRVFASKRGWTLRRTVKLDPVAEFFLYEFVYRNRALFRKKVSSRRTVYGFSIVKGEPISHADGYSAYKGALARHRNAFEAYAYIDIAAYFNHVYHHDLVRWFEGAGGSQEDVEWLGRFLREINSGRSIDCLPQGLYPAKMIGSAFLGFLEDTNRLRAEQSVRFMDDVWFFDTDPGVVIADFVLAQSLLADKGLSINEAKSRLGETAGDGDAVPGGDLSAMKVELLRRRREELSNLGGYDGELDDEEELGDLTDEEQDYLVSLLRQDTVAEEDAELVLALMRQHSADVMEHLPSLVADFPALAKRLFHFCEGVEDKRGLVGVLADFLRGSTYPTEFQLFWFARLAEAYLLKTKGADELLRLLYEHERATDISRAAVLEIPSSKFGLPDLREEQLRTGHSDWLSWSAAVGARVHPKGQRNQMLKYFRKSSEMNRLIGEFVQTCF